MNGNVQPHRSGSGRCRKFFTILAWLSFVLALFAMPHAAAQDPALALLARDDHLGITRHALAPGTGNPPGFRLNDCGKQRNLSEDGRRQSARLGERLRTAGEPNSSVTWPVFPRSVIRGGAG